MTASGAASVDRARIEAGLDDKRALMRIGSGVFDRSVLDGRRAALCTMPEPLALLDPALVAAFAHIEHVHSMDAEVVDAVAAALPADIELVVGCGGGSSLDLAKYLAWRRGLPGIMVPSILSVDACVTATAAVRSQNRVRYVGRFVPEAILIDHALLAAAPASLNRAGAADILSIHTALHDWEAAARAQGDPYDAGVAEEARALLARLREHADDIRRCTPAGLTFLAEAFAIEDAFCTRFGSSRPEEGSEHFLAYVIEYRTRRQFIHGELVGLGIVVMSALQANDPTGAAATLDALGIPYDLAHLGLDEHALREAVAALPAYVRAEGLPYTVADTLDADPAATRRALDQVIDRHVGRGGSA